MPISTGLDPLIRAMSAAVARVHQPGSAGYDELAAPAVPGRRPTAALVVEALSDQDVVNAVRTATAFGAPVAVRCTGLGGAEPPAGAVLVSTHALDTLLVRPAARTARIGAGIRWQDLLVVAGRHGLTPVCGSSSRVGVVGDLIAGGHGPAARSWGLASDRVLGFDVVTGDGVLRHAGPTQHPGLYWGLRGAKGTLGVVTAVDLELVEQAEVYAGSLWFDETDLPAVLAAWAPWARGLPEQGTTSVAITRMPAGPRVPAALTGATTLAVRFVWTGAAAAGERALAPLRALATPLVDTVAMLPAAAICAAHGDRGPSPATATSTLLLDELDGAATARLIELTGPGSGCRQAVVEVRHLGGAISRPLHGASVCAHRDARWALVTEGPPAPGVAEDAGRITAGLADWAAPGALVDLLAPDDPHWADRAFGPEGIARLADLSGRYDPAGTLAAGRWLRSA
jgi:FAD/FMN-containing dehydrogenase